jgi:hypothetical protein
VSVAKSLECLLAALASNAQTKILISFRNLDKSMTNPWERVHEYSCSVVVVWAYLVLHLVFLLVQLANNSQVGYIYSCTRTTRCEMNTVFTHFAKKWGLDRLRKKQTSGNKTRFARSNSLF